MNPSWKKALYCAGILMLMCPVDLRAESPGDRGSSQEEHIRIVRTGGFSPFRSIEWSVLVLNGTPLARQRKTMVNYTENMGSMRLLTREEYSALWDELAPLAVFGLEERPTLEKRSPDGGVRYRIEVARDGKQRTWVVDGDESGAGDPTLGPMIAHVQALVERHTDPIPFRNVFFEEGEIGYVDVDSIPPARVFIDGVDTKRKTPLHTYEIRRGQHEIRLVAEDEGLERVYTFRVQPGMTTVLRLDLR